jgi:hypothetical protein
MKLGGLPFVEPIGDRTETARNLEEIRSIKDIANQVPGAIFNNQTDPNKMQKQINAKFDYIGKIANESDNRGK